jgi:hypothetical protein
MRSYIFILKKEIHQNLIDTSGDLGLILSYRYSDVLSYLLTLWSRVLLKKLTGSAASQKIPRNFGTRRIITVLKSARHLSLT